MAPVTTLSSRDFDQNVSEARNAAEKGPVFITDHGRSTHVLLSIEDYRQLAGGGGKIADLLSLDRVDEIELKIPSFRDGAVAADIS